MGREAAKNARRQTSPRPHDTRSRDGAELRVVCERNSGYLAAAARWPGRPVTGLGADGGYWGAARSPKEIQEAIEWANSMALGMGRGRKGCNAARNPRARNPMVTPEEPVLIDEGAWLLLGEDI